MPTTISSPEDRAKIKAALKDISNLMTKVEDIRATIKESLTELSKEYDIPKRTINKMAKVYHKQSFFETQQENDEFETLYETVVESTSVNTSIQP